MGFEVALRERVDVESEEGIEALNKFSFAIATTDVRDCFHRFRMPLSLGEFSCLRAVPAYVNPMTGEMLEGQAGSAYCHLATLGVLSMGFSWSLFLAQSCNEEKACLPARHTFEITTVGRRLCSSLVSGSMEVHTWSLTTLKRSPLVWLFTKLKSLWAWVGHSGQNWTVASSLTCDVKAFLDVAAGTHGNAASRTMQWPRTGIGHWSLHFHVCRISGNVVHVSHLLPLHSVPATSKTVISGTQVLAELRCFRRLLLVLSSSLWFSWNPCVLQSGASLEGWAFTASDHVRRLLKLVECWK